MQQGNAARAKGVPIPVAQNEIRGSERWPSLNGKSVHETDDPAPAQKCCSDFEPAAGLTCGLGSGNRVWSLSDAAASDRPEAWLAGSVSACASSGWCRWIGPRRPAGRRRCSRARVGARARVHEPSPLPAEGRRSWGLTSEGGADDSDPLLARTESKASRLPPTSLVTGPGSNFEPETRIRVTRPPGECVYSRSGL